jgi:peptidoglycan L-alanyl-D-glutamate endopeptidase CwlK
VRRAAEGGATFRVTEGLRTRERQAELVASGASQTMNSRHLTGHAIDIAPIADGVVSWNWTHFFPLADAVADAARKEGVRSSGAAHGGARCKTGPRAALRRRRMPMWQSGARWGASRSLTGRTLNCRRRSIRRGEPFS